MHRGHGSSLTTFCIVTFFLGCLSVTAAFDEDILYVSRSQGNDSVTCGTVRQPCKTIVHAIGLAQQRSQIYLDGTGSDLEPYNCDQAERDHSWVLINKSLSFVGFRSIPHIACFPGFVFTCPGSQQLSKLSGLLFHNTSVQFHDCSAVITNCSFINAQNAVYLQARNTSKVSLSVTLSWFHNNNGCITALFQGNIKRIRASLDIRETTFHNNRATTAERGLICVANTKDDIFQNSDTSLWINIHQVNFTENHGPLITTDHNAAIIKETCKQMRFLKNKASLDKGVKALWKSLHVSRAKNVEIIYEAVHSEGNTNSRCIAVHANVVKLSVNRSRFMGHKVEGQGGSVLVNRASNVDFTIADTEFTRSEADSAGAIFIARTHKKGSFHVYDTRFFKSKANDGAIVIANDNKGAMSFDLRFHNVTVESCDTTALVAFLAGPSFVNMIDTYWLNNMGGAISIAGTRAVHITMVIQGCVIQGNQDILGQIVYVYSSFPRSGTVTVFDTIVHGNSGGFFILDTLATNFTNVTFESSVQKAIWILSNEFYSNVTVHIQNCLFRNNSWGLVLFLQGCDSLNISIVNSIFVDTGTPLESSGGAAIEMLLISDFTNGSTSSWVLLNNITVKFNTVSSPFQNDAAVALDFSRFPAKEGIHVHVRDSRFRRNVNLEDVQTGKAGSLLVAMPSDELQSSGCAEDQNRTKYRKWRYKNHVIIRDTWFEENVGPVGALYILNGNLTCINCTFINNFGSDRAGHIYVEDGSARLATTNCTFLQTKTNLQREYPSFAFIYMDSAGPLLSWNTVYSSQVFHENVLLTVAKGGYVQADNFSTLQCSTGSPLTVQDFSHMVDTEYLSKPCQLTITVLAFSCKPCGAGLYSLQRGNSSGITVKADFKCYPCPYGANCTGSENILARQNFWGYRSPADSSKLTFTVCPSNYCVPPDGHSPSVYNACYGNRSGVLCGHCKPQFTETLFSTQCTSRRDCNDHWFWALFIVFVLALALYFVVKPPLVHYIIKQVFWFRGKYESRTDGKDSDHADKGYLKIVFYFYQIAHVLMLESFEGLLQEVHVLSALVSAFNFQARLPVAGHSICPFPGMTAAIKEMFLASEVLGTFVAILLLFTAHCALNITRKLQRPSAARYLGAILETLLLGYATLARTTLKLLTCVPLDETRLFYEGDTQCLQWWQIIFIVYLAVVLVPFIGVLFWGSLQLYKRQWTHWEFLFACFLPLPFSAYRIIKHFRRGETGMTQRACTEHDDNRAALSRVLHEPFRSPTEQTTGTLYWESVLTGRRFIILCLHSWITDPLVRLFLITLACLVFLQHHTLVQPFTDSTANLCEVVSLSTLVVIAIINLVKATTISAGTVVLGPIKEHIRGMEWLEVTLLGIFPVIFLLFIGFGILSLIIRCVIILFQYCCTYVRACSLLKGMSPQHDSLNPDEITPLLQSDD